MVALKELQVNVLVSEWRSVMSASAPWGQHHAQRCLTSLLVMQMLELSAWTWGCWLMIYISQQLALAAQRADHILGCTKSSVGRRVREGIVPLCSALLRPHLQPCIHLWGPQHKEGMDLLEQAQRRPRG